MPEWSNGAVSKTVVLFMGTKGSNPFLSAPPRRWISVRGVAQLVSAAALGASGRRF